MIEPVVLDWSVGKDHYGKTAAKCIHCPGKTYLRNHAYKPAHKVCQERADTDELSRGHGRGDMRPGRS